MSNGTMTVPEPQPLPIAEPTPIPLENPWDELTKAVQGIATQLAVLTVIIEEMAEHPTRA